MGRRSGSTAASSDLPMFAGERILVSRYSAFQLILLTEDAAGLRRLRFGSAGASQSLVNAADPRHLALPYARLLPACLGFVDTPRRILIVGLGGGTLPRFFHCHFPEMTIDVVELDGEVVALAKEYCGFQEDARMHVFVEDGRDFIEGTQHSYDLVVLDSFDTDSIPPHLTTRQFLAGVGRILTPRGIVVANVWGSALNPLYADMLLTYRAAFEDVYVLDVPAPGTKLFVGLPKPRVMTREELLEKATALARQRGFTYDLPAALAGFRNATLEKIREGVVLED
jgi:spermidine synthase